jgi:glycosyltransferase involved in cell wall biosynthesis
VAAEWRDAGIAVVRPSPSIGVLAEGDPLDPASFSGVPAALLSALDTVGCRTIPLSVSPREPLQSFAAVAGLLPTLLRPDLVGRHPVEQRWAIARQSRPVRVASRSAVRTQMASAGRLDALVQLEGELRSPPGLPMVVFHDSTIVQAARSYDWLHLRGLSRRQLRRSVAWQRSAYQSAVTCCAATHWAADSMARDYGVPIEKIHVVGRGANHLPSVSHERDWSTPRFLFVGGDWKRKNGAGLLEAFARVRAQIPSATLDVVGDHPPLGDPGVTGHGRLSSVDPDARRTMNRLYGTATVFVLPSLHEPLGISHIEAGHAGLASIGTTNGGSATFIGDAGRCIDPARPEALQGAMIELSNGELARALGERAHARAQLFTWELVAQRLLRALALPGFDISAFAAFL